MDLKIAYQRLIRNNGPYKYHVSLTASRNYSEEELLRRVHFLLKCLSHEIFHNRNGKILISGFCFIESSSEGSLCSKHCHFLINDDAKLGDYALFTNRLHRAMKRVKVIIRGKVTNLIEFSSNCVSVTEVEEIERLISYLTDEFWKDRCGDFVKIIHTEGLIQ